MAEPTRRLISVQRLRGIAAVAVVALHAGIAVEAARPVVGRSVILSFHHLANFGAIGVDLFFVISGFVMALSMQRLRGPRDSLSFLRLRWVRIAPPYLMITAALVLLRYATQRLQPAPAGLLNAILFIPLADGSSYTPPPLEVGWTLSFEFTFYLAVTAVVAFGPVKRTLVLFVVLIFAATLGTFFHASALLVTWFVNPIYFEFAFGVLAYTLWDRRLLSRFRVLSLAIGAVSLAVLVIEIFLGYSEVNSPAQTLNGLGSANRVLIWGLPSLGIFVSALVLPQSGSGRLGRLLDRLGDASYSIYLIHVPVLDYLRAIVVRLPEMPIADGVLVASIVVGVAAGVPTYRWVERPVTRRLRRYLEDRPRAAGHPGRGPA